MKIFILILFIFLANNCSLNKVEKRHGVPGLEKKIGKLKIDISNKNDAVKLIGPPSTKNTFNNDIWIYIERITTVSSLKKFSKKNLIVNNVLILEFDNRGLLVKKSFLDKNQINNYKFDENATGVTRSRDSFVNNILNTLRKKINDPLGQRRIRPVKD
jgi:outer membrane protein assembly factor BamE (lipoprotein component of BamABCDE complex)